MFPNVGTKGTGEPVVQPAGRKRSVCVGHWYPPKKFRVYAAMLVLTITLVACSQPQNQANFVAYPQNLPSTGGSIQLDWQVDGATRYTLRSEPPLPGLPLVTTGSSATVRLQGNSGSTAKSYRFTLEAGSSQGLKQKTIQIRLEGRLVCEVGASALGQAGAKSQPTVRGRGRFDVPHVPGRLLVYSQGSSVQSVSPGSLGAQLLSELGDGWKLYQTQSGQEAAVAEKLSKQGLGQYIQPEYLYQPDGLTTPPANRDYSLDQAALFGQMNLEGAWQQLDDNCAKPVVAVVDSGVYTSRADLAPNLTASDSWLDVVGSNLDQPNPRQGSAQPHAGTGGSHGTGVAGIIAATTNDGSALAGAAYNLVKVLPIKVFDEKRRAGTLQLAQAIEYATGSTTIAGQTFQNPSPAQVVNLSLSLMASGFSDPYLEGVLEQVSQQGVIVVASSGNAGMDSVGYPASSPYVIAVGASDALGKRAQWGSGFGSNYGPDLEFVAPGTAVPVLYGNSKGDYGMAYGTSAAAPLISTTVALYALQNQQRYGSVYGLSQPRDFLVQVRQCLQSAAQNSQWEAQEGYGLVDVAKTVDPGNRVCYPEGQP